MSERPRLMTGAQLLSVAIAFLLSVVVAIVLAIVVPPAARLATPDIPVKAYLGALARGDVPAALKAGHVPVSGDKLLTTDAYATASDRITSFSITSTQVSGSTATIAARIHQGTASYTTRFTATRGAGVPGLTPWSLAPQQLPQLAVAVVGPTSASVDVAGTKLATRNNTVTQAVLPGTYAVEPASSPSYGAPPQKVTAVLGRPSASATIAMTLTAQGKTEVQASASAWLATCVASTALAPSGCPFRAVGTAGVSYSQGRWTMAAQPTLAFGGWNSTADGWQVTSTTLGEVSFIARARSGAASGTASTGPQLFSVLGTAVPTNSGASFVPSPSYSSSAGSLA
ncbi:hypothetical protein ACFOYW_03505 [Gryllotalpicola reticulitermitis]|uniref:Uncharacterized protein n=1 Tax=Gryllotalpicola reticulitermitis TaxID=1184153 RepID=A0ABV8Q445_9MICO